MGREAECVCTWGTESAKVKILLETGELILRGAIRRRAPLSELERVRAEEGRLLFRYQGEDVCLMLGDDTAAKWQQLICAPAVPLAKKLGITAGS